MSQPLEAETSFKTHLAQDRRKVCVLPPSFPHSLLAFFLIREMSRGQDSYFLTLRESSPPFLKHLSQRHAGWGSRLIRCSLIVLLRDGGMLCPHIFCLLCPTLRVGTRTTTGPSHASVAPREPTGNYMTFKFSSSSIHPGSGGKPLLAWEKAHN